MLEQVKNFLDSVSRGCGKTFREDSGFFALLNILNISVFLEVILKNPETKTELIMLVLDHAKIFLLGAVQIFILCVAIHFLFSRLPKVKKFVQVVTGIYFFLVCVTDIFLIFRFQTVMMYIVMATILGTNPFSVKEFLRDYILKPYVFALVIAGVGFIFLTVKALKKFLTDFFMTRVFEKISQPAQRFLIVGILVLLTGLWSHWVYRAYAFGDWDPDKDILTSTAVGRVSMTFYYFVHNFPIGDEEKIFAEMDKQNEAEKILEDKSEVPYIIFVIGESADRNHMSLYGYNLETNPLLQKRLDGGELIRFNDVIACGNTTPVAMATMGTFAEKEDPMNEWCYRANLFDLMKRAGYYTVWISNQSRYGVFGNFDTYFSARCDEKFFTDVAYGNRVLDGLLLKTVDEYLEKPHEKNFYVIHLTGQHWTYSERYPAEFAKFTAADEDKPEEKWREKTAEYDNATLYNDFVLDEIIKRFENKNAVVIYISDHGNEVYEGRDFAGHSPEAIGNVHMIEVPMFVWTSKIFREKYPEKISQFKSAVDRPYRLDSIIHSFLDLADIRTTSYDPTKSIWNEKFEPRPRIYNGKLYEKK